MTSYMDSDCRSDDLTLPFRQEEREVIVMAIEFIPHAFKISKWSRYEIVTVGCLEVDLVKFEEVFLFPTEDFDSLFLGLLNISPPLLIETNRKTFFIVIAQVKLKDKVWLPFAKTVL